MKFFQFSLVSLFIVLALASCKKVVLSNWSSGPKISFKAGGITKEAKGDKNVFATFSSTENVLQIIGNIDGNGVEALNLGINNFKGVGEYSAETDFLGTFSTELNFESTYIGLTGRIKVTSYTETAVKGEFEFEGKNGDGDVKIITEGKFESKLYRM